MFETSLFSHHQYQLITSVMKRHAYGGLDDWWYVNLSHRTPALTDHLVTADWEPGTAASATNHLA